MSVRQSVSYTILNRSSSLSQCLQGVSNAEWVQNILSIRATAKDKD